MLMDIHQLCLADLLLLVGSVWDRGTSTKSLISGNHSCLSFEQKLMWHWDTNDPDWLNTWAIIYYHKTKRTDDIIGYKLHVTFWTLSLSVRYSSDCITWDNTETVCACCEVFNNSCQLAPPPHSPSVECPPLVQRSCLPVVPTLSKHSIDCSIASRTLNASTCTWEWVLNSNISNMLWVPKPFSLRSLNTLLWDWSAQCVVGHTHLDSVLPRLPLHLPPCQWSLSGVEQLAMLGSLRATAPLQSILSWTLKLNHQKGVWTDDCRHPGSTWKLVSEIYTDRVNTKSLLIRWLSYLPPSFSLNSTKVRDQEVKEFVRVYS